MNQVTCFRIEESPSNPGKYLICPVHDVLHLNYTEGSYNVICARLMNLSYAQYLRFCRDLCGAQIIGKNQAFPVAYFPQGERVQALCRLLNARANLVLWCREHPNWRQHQEELAAWEAKHNVFNK